ncbi:DUF4347 domain-containing protein [filamentous cyanobacterium LEGE 11480]|uniref:DUF4347 domain-containing protein n=1 Tax=Romeriopsis navalis LEGE 11480 TaxID=2777977 RepID=A0A928Z3T7_9CYAN|nr:DUF4347 domain-containing protein [Romeriopsis navalis]MBE9029630.1 DUF4347 domain-containing protein [Romeriopsis navalis LEGE 11480]
MLNSIIVPTVPVVDPTAVLFVDAGVGQRELLTQSAASGTAVYWLDAERDAIGQITTVLAAHRGLESVQIASHGMIGGVQLGGDWLSAANLSNYVGHLKTWGEALSETGDLLLYGCEVGQGAVGSDFVASLAAMTGADVAASNNLTGHHSLGGDWDLEVMSGAIEAVGLVADEFQNVLNPIITLPSLAVSYQENAAPVILDVGATVSDSTSADFDTGSLTVSVSSGGTADDRLSINNQGTGTNQIGLDGRIVTYEGSRIGTYTGGIGGSDQLVISLEAAATAVATQALVRNLAYSNVSEDLATGNRTVQIVLNDGDGNVSATVGKPVQVTGTNDGLTFRQKTIIYDGSSGQTPDQTASLFYQDSTVFPVNQGTASAVAANGGTTLTTDADAYSGYSSYAVNFTVFPPSITTQLKNPNFPTLDRNQGYAVSFTADVISESRTAAANKDNYRGDDRAGFSVIVVSSDGQNAIELGFQRLSSTTLRVFAQEDGTNQSNQALEPSLNGDAQYRQLFSQAESADFSATGAVSYDLLVSGDTYTLLVNGNAVLSGRLRDYTAFVPQTVFNVQPPSPYQQANMVVFGDNTPTAQTQTKIDQIAISTNAAVTLPGLSVDAGNSLSVTGLSDLLIFDRDLPNTLTLTLTTTSGNVTVNSNVSGGVTAGNITQNGSKTVTLTGSLSQITQTLIAANALTYQASANFSGNDQLTITLDDGSGAQTVAQTMDIAVSGPKAEILWRNTRLGISTFWYLNNATEFVAAQSLVYGAGIGDSRVGTEVNWDPSWRLAGVADFNSDGIQDHLYENGVDILISTLGRTNGQTATLESAVSPTINGVTRTIPVGWDLVGAADMNRDGIGDLIFRSQALDITAIWQMGNTNQVTNPVLVTNTSNEIARTGALGQFSPWTLDAIGDFDGDNDIDFVYRWAAANLTALWTMNGLQVESTALLNVSAPVGFEVRGVGDFNGDGTQDIVLRNQLTDQTKLWTFSNGVATESFLPATGSPAWQIEAIADMNGDGTDDLIWQNRAADFAAVWVMQNGQVSAASNLVRDFRVGGSQGAIQSGDPGWDIEDAAAAPAANLM